ncbi:hypothetical protein GO986_06580 [Deinococcus sp. HMF7620]|uniref:Uncharacterized protein n=1 Tax=Deinococcus arboris TaxID=2682977 RepID=A0A7C9HQT0_9DEIO|nr:hypothetical protein [Deinococcus arboris]MVN86429.1 hypothetical protein [Deinococcus arboris]
MKTIFCTALLSVFALASAAGYDMKSTLQLGDQAAQPLLAWCEAPNAVITLTTLQSGQATLTVRDKQAKSLGPVRAFPVTVGDPDPGAGQVYTPLSWKSGGTTVEGFLHTSNVENVRDPAYRMTHVNEFKLGDVTHRCRYVPQAAFLGATDRRAVIIWQQGDRVTYATRNFDGTPGVYVTGGRPVDFGTETGWGYEFTAGGYTYTVARGDFSPRPLMRLTVRQGDKVVQTELFHAYSLSLPQP